MVLKPELRRRALNYLSRVAPGLTQLLNVLCFKLGGGRDCLDILVDEPQKFVDVLKSFYKENPIIETILSIHIASIMPEPRDLNTAMQLAKMLTSNPQEFKDVLAKFIAIAG